MKVKIHAWFGSAGVATKTRASLGALGTGMAPGLAWANTEAAGTASTGPDLSGVERVLRLFNRPRDGEDTGKPWRIGALVLVLLFMLGLWWSR